MKLRPATLSDTPFLRQLHHRAYREVVIRQFGSWDDDAQDGWFEKGLADAQFSVVEENGEAIGAVASNDLPDRLVLVELQVLPEHQGRGIGTALLRAQLDWARRLRKPVSLRVLFENRAQSLYARHGFVVTGKTDTHYLMEWRPDGPPIRLAAQSDVEAIARVHVKTWQSAYRGHMPDAHLDSLDAAKRAAMWSKALEQQSTLVLVATSDDALVGFCSLEPSRDADAASTVREIVAIYVDPAFWRCGFGSALIEGIVESAHPKGVSEITLWVLTDNAPARQFYEARGFNADGHTKTDARWGFPLHETRYRRRIADHAVLSRMHRLA